MTDEALQMGRSGDRPWIVNIDVGTTRCRRRTRDACELAGRGGVVGDPRRDCWCGRAWTRTPLSKIWSSRNERWECPWCSSRFTRNSVTGRCLPLYDYVPVSGF